MAGSRFQKVVNSRFGIWLAFGLGQIVPPSVGLPLARFVADRVTSRRNAPMVQAARANQWVVSRGRLNGEQLDCAVRETFRNNAGCLYDLYHTFRNPEAIQRRVVYNPAAEELIDRTRKGEDSGRPGLVVVGMHLSNFDLVMQAAGLRGMNVLVISIAQPGGGYRLQNDLRRERGLEMTPASMSALKQAVERLRSGRSVLTGLDRPVPETGYRPRFFGRPAALPLHHIYLAMKTGAPVYVFAARQASDGLYHLGAVGPIEIRPMQDHHAAMLYNGERVLEAAEGLICQAPQQWSMFYPVWPEALAEVP